MIEIRKYLVILTCALGLTGCAATRDTPLYSPPSGSQIKVNQELSTNGGKRLFIQSGFVLERKNVNIVNPYCWFSIRDSSDETRQPVVIRPGIFTISKSYRQQDWSAAEGVQYAGDTDRGMTTIMNLTSDSQPEVTSLACSRWGSVYVGGWVTISEIQATLSGLAKLILVE